MKRKIIIVVCSLLVIVGAVIACVCLRRQKVIEGGAFSLEDYQEQIELYAPVEPINVGSLSTAKEAGEKAEEIWLDQYGKDVKHKKPYKVYFDDANDAWLVCGSIRANRAGGVPYVLFKSNGDVLAVWHDK